MEFLARHFATRSKATAFERAGEAGHQGLGSLTAGTSTARDPHVADDATVAGDVEVDRRFVLAAERRGFERFFVTCQDTRQMFRSGRRSHLGVEPSTRDAACEQREGNREQRLHRFGTNTRRSIAL